jgi:hypothetical protein
MASFIAGDFIRYTASFVIEPAGTPSDPAEVVFIYSIGGLPSTQLKYSASASVTGDIIRDSTGNYHVDLDTTGSASVSAVNWVSEWASKGAPQTISPATTISVQPPTFVPAF